MLRRTIKSTILLSFLFLLSVIPALAHGGDEEGGAEAAASSTGFTLTGSTILGIAVVASIVVAIGLVTVKSSLNLRQVQFGVIGLATMTAVIHLLIGLNEFILLLNGLGYLALIAGIYLLPPFKGFRGPLTWVLIGYTIVTIVLYFVSHPWGYEHGSLDRLGLVTKAIEIALAGLVLVEWWQRQRTPSLPTATPAQ